jgi:hypothetical protein
MARRVNAQFTDADLFDIAILPQRRKTGEPAHASNQTEVILAADAETMTTRTSEIATMTDEVVALKLTEDSDEGKNGAEGKEAESGGPNLARLNAMLRRTAPLLEAQLEENCFSTALNGYPPPLPQALMGEHAFSGREGGAGDQQHHQSFRAPAAAAAQHLQCTGIGWNAGGGVLVASYGRRDMGGWCESGGLLCAWPLFRRDFDPDAPPEVNNDYVRILMQAFPPLCSHFSVCFPPSLSLFPRW